MYAFVHMCICNKTLELVECYTKDYWPRTCYSSCNGIHTEVKRKYDKDWVRYVYVYNCICI